MTPPAPAPLPSSRQRLLAALPTAALGLQFLLAHWQLYLPGLGPGLFAPLLQAEMLVLLASLFMGAIALLPASGAQEARGRRLLFRATAVFFGLIALDSGVLVLAGYAAMLIATNAGSWLERRMDAAGLQFALRVGMAFVAFIICINVAGLPERVEDWDARDSTYTAGTLYFLALAALEWRGVYARLGQRWLVRLAPLLAAAAARTGAGPVYARVGAWAARLDRLRGRPIASGAARGGHSAPPRHNKNNAGRP